MGSRLRKERKKRGDQLLPRDKEGTLPELRKGVMFDARGRQLPAEVVQRNLAKLGTSIEEVHARRFGHPVWPKREMDATDAIE